MPSYEFVIRLVGVGETEDEAWQDATDSFNQDPGEPQEVTELIDDEEEA